MRGVLRFWQILRSPPKSPALKRWLSVACLLAFFAFARGALALPGEASTENLALRVLVLANSDVPGSVEIAQHYAAARGVPTENIIAFPMPTAEEITWGEFVPKIWAPLLMRLVRDRWIDAIPMDLTDPIGRKKYAVYTHRIAALVVCRGVPLKIAHDPSRYAPVLPLTTRSEFRTNAGAVDGELSLLAMPNYPINAWVPNPLFQNAHPQAYDEALVVKVSRLDGPTVQDAFELVDRALAAEHDGLIGRAYVDLGDRDPVGNQWFDSVATQLDQAGFEVTVDRAPATFPLTARIDAPALYFGWYANDVNGPFTLPGFRFPPGAIALHLHSYSAASLRSPTSGWTAPFVARGVTATVGNVYEPYLGWTHRPDLLVRALIRGEDLVDAAYYSLQGLSWQEVLIGDPLYRPFAVPLEQQLQRLPTLPARLEPYVILRRVKQLEGTGHRAQAMELLQTTQAQRPSLAIGLALASRRHAAGNDKAAVDALAFLTDVHEFAANDWAVVRDAARLLAACGRPDRAVAVWRLLFSDQRLPFALRQPWLEEAQTDARAAGDAAQADAWKTEAEPAPVPGV